MDAMIIREFGSADAFERTTVPKPKTKPGHVLIKVMASSVNPLDIRLRSGLIPHVIREFPIILHGDMAGIIEEIGEDVHGFSIGDEVYGCTGGFLDLPGALTEYIVADVNLIAHKPKTLSFCESAALPLVSLTAWEGLVTYANVQKNQSVLVHGGTGGVGHIAIQLAKLLGAHVFATSSSLEKNKLAKELGADSTINYKDMSVSDYVLQYTQNIGFDVVFDTVGGENLLSSFEAAALFGKVITLMAFGSFDLTPAFMKGLSIHLIKQTLPLVTGARRAHYGMILNQVARLVDEGAIRPLLDPNEFTIPQVAKAHAHLESGKAIGKIVLKADW